MSLFKARVSSVTRRYAEICDESYNFTLAKIATRALDICIGDEVTCERQKEETMVVEVASRRNILNRSYQGRTKDIVANVDHLYIMTAVGPLLNTVFIDRILAVAFLRNITPTIILNKIDKTEELLEAKQILNCYSQINIPIHEISIKKGIGVNELRQEFSSTDHKLIALCGVSGVGKSSLINQLLPDAAARIDSVSTRTGQGKQTTTQAIAYPFPEISPTLLLVDTPGLQSFGVSHLSIEEARASFIEFGNECRFQDCKHISEPECSVLKKIAAGLIAQSRYDSYRGTLEEILAVKKY